MSTARIPHSHTRTHAHTREGAHGSVGYAPPKRLQCAPGRRKPWKYALKNEDKDKTNLTQNSKVKIAATFSSKLIKFNLLSNQINLVLSPRVSLCFMKNETPDI